MRKLIMSLMAIALPFAASADEYAYLSFETSDGSLESVSIESLSMTFSDNRLIVENVDGKKEFSVADLGRMFFSATPSGITDVKTAANGYRDVYTVSGMFVGRFAAGEDLKSELKSGLYIIKDNSNTTKIMVR